MRGGGGGEWWRWWWWQWRRVTSVRERVERTNPCGCLSLMLAVRCDSVRWSPTRTPARPRTIAVSAFTGASGRSTFSTPMYVASWCVAAAASKVCFKSRRSASSAENGCGGLATSYSLAAAARYAGTSIPSASARTGSHMQSSRRSRLGFGCAAPPPAATPG